MNIKIVFYFLYLVFYSSTCFGQKEGNNWYFGNGYSVNFNSGKPINVKRSNMSTKFGCGAISTATGRTLFYSNGLSLYDSSDTVIPNINLNTYHLSSQPAFFVPYPDSSHLYFLFSPSVEDDSCLRYSIINCKLRSGFGDIEKGKRMLKLDGFALGKINAVRHSNRHDYWLMIPKVNTDSVYAFLITNKGIQATPVRSKIGVVFKSQVISDHYLGYLKFSPDGKKVGHVSVYDSSFIADFDASNGKVRNPLWFYSRGALSFEYSNTSRYLYMCQYQNQVVQYNLESASRDDFLASKKTIDSGYFGSYAYGAMQLASDGKIYIFPDPRFTSNPNFAFLNVIHSPDSIGKKSRVERNYLNLGYFTSTGSVGLPDFIQSFFHKPSFGFRQNCANDTVFFTIRDTYQLDSVQWDFGDTTSGNLNVSKQTKSVFHYYKKMGFYKVRLISFHKGFTDTIYETFLLKPLKPNLGKDTTFCKSKFLLLRPNEDYAGYQWSNSQTVKSVYVTNPGIYYLTVSDYFGCKGNDTIVVSKPNVKADFAINNVGQCITNNAFELKETTNYKDGLRKKNTWLSVDSIIGKDSVLKISYFAIGNFSIKLLSESYGGCRDSITKTLNVYPIAKVSFTTNDSLQCFNNHSFNFKINQDTGKINYEWDLGDQSITSSNDIISKRYLKDGTYRISLMAATEKNCKDTLTKSITILPNPKAGFSWDLACNRTVTNFKYSGSKPIQTFNWDFSSEGSSILENPSKLFSTIVTKKIKLIINAYNSCADTIIKDVIVKPQSKADFTTTDVCETDSAIFKNLSQDATSYYWKFGDAAISNLQSAKHNYQITTTTTFNVTLVALVKNGCSDSIVKPITINQNPQSDFTSSQNVNKLDLKAKAGYTNYKWIIENMDSFTSSNPNFIYTLKNYIPHKVCLTVKDAIGCSSQTCKTISLGISKISKSRGFKIYPNPNSGSFIIEIENVASDISIEIYDVLGQLIQKEQISMNKTIYFIDLNRKSSLFGGMGTGIFFVNVKNGNEVWNQKMVVSIGDTK